MNIVAVPPRPELIAGARPTAIIPRSMDEAYRLAKAIVLSGTAPKGVTTPEACMIAIMHGLEIGLPPLTALQRISVINGRPTLWGDGAISLVRGSGCCEYINERIEGEGEGTTAVCEVQRRGEPAPIMRTFSVADAKRAGLWNKAGPWQQYPARMLTMRARGFALRDGFADVLGGMYLREEVDEDERPSSARDVSGTITSGIGDKPGQLRRARAQHPPQPTPTPQPRPPSPIPPQPDDEEEDWPPPPSDEDMVEIETPPEEPGHPGSEDERARLLEAAHEKARQGSRKLRWWRARLTPEQEALIGDWTGLENRPRLPMADDFAMVAFCPHCGRQEESFRLLCESGGPAPGKATLCDHCGAWNVWDDQMDLRPPTREEQAEIAADDEAREIMREWALDFMSRHLPPKRMQ